MDRDHTPFRSPFARLIHTNHVPDTAQRNEILQFLLQPQQRVLDLNVQVSQLEAQLELLKNERDSLQSHIDDHLALISPFRRLSEDIVREIFVHCRDTCPVRSTKDAPLLLTRVCQSWYRIAMDTPRLWSAIHIQIPPFHGLHGERSLTAKERDLVDQRARGIRWWLDKSGSLPISFSLSISAAHLWRDWGGHGFVINRQYLEAVHSIINAFLHYRRRWKAARLHGVSAEILEPFLVVKQGEVPRLQSMRVGFMRPKGHPASEDSDFQNLHPILECARSLHQFSLNLADLRNKNIIQVPIRWDQMSEIQLQSPEQALSPYDVLAVLTAVNRTIQKFCCILKVEVRAQDLLGLPLIHLPKLNKLSLAFRKASDDLAGLMALQGWGPANPTNPNLFTDALTKVLRMISCPSLEDFTFEIVSDVGTTHHVLPLEQFIQNSGCSLKAFTTNLTLLEAGFGSLLRAMPSIAILKHFVMQWQIDIARSTLPLTAPHPVLQAIISSTGSDDVLCPALEDFHITHISPEDAEPILGWTRTRIGSGLRTLTLVFDGYTPEEYRRDVEGLREQGLTVNWVYRHPVLIEDPPEEGRQVLRGSTDSGNDWDVKWMPSSMTFSDSNLSNENFGRY